MTEHWIDKAIREGRDIRLVGNTPRISAETLVKLNELRNALLGTDYSLYEAAIIAEDKNEQVF